MKPVFCPNQQCLFHSPPHLDRNPPWYIHYGYHQTKVIGPVRRYRCKWCGRTFSDRTFDIDYFAKKAIPYDQVFLRLSSSESVSAMARNLGVLSGSIQNRIDRLAREAIALHERLERGVVLAENLVADGFESFDRSQYFPNQINLLVGQNSQYLYGFTHTTIRRKGRMTEKQQTKRKDIETRYRAARGGIESSFAVLLGCIPRLWNKIRFPSLTLLTDEHPSYPRALARVIPLIRESHAGSFHHLRFPSTLPRTIHNPLFSVNYYDRDLRKDVAAYHRESTCFCRNTANGLSRLAVHQAWHNFVKPFRIKPATGSRGPHGAYRGIAEKRIACELTRFLCDRSFLSHLDLREDRLTIWMKHAKTPLKENQEYLPKYASA